MPGSSLLMPKTVVNTKRLQGILIIPAKAKWVLTFIRWVLHCYGLGGQLREVGWWPLWRFVFGIYSFASKSTGIWRFVFGIYSFASKTSLDFGWSWIRNPDDIFDNKNLESLQDYFLVTLLFKLLLIDPFISLKNPAIHCLQPDCYQRMSGSQYPRLKESRGPDNNYGFYHLFERITGIGNRLLRCHWNILTDITQIRHPSTSHWNSSYLKLGIQRPVIGIHSILLSNGDDKKH